MKGYLRLKRTVEINQAGVFPQCETVFGQRYDAISSYNHAVKVRAEKLLLDKQEHIAFVVDTPHNRCQNLLTPKGFSVEYFNEKRGVWVKVDPEAFRRLVLSKGYDEKELETLSPGEEDGKSDERVDVGNFEDVLKLAKKDQDDLIKEPECPEMVLREAAASTDKRLSAKAKSIAVSRVAKLDLDAANAGGGASAATEANAQGGEQAQGQAT